MHPQRFAALTAPLATLCLAVLSACQPAPDESTRATAPVEPASVGTTDPDTGFALSGPYAHENLQVWIVHGPDTTPPGQTLLPLQDAIEQGVAVVHETGSVNELAIENRSPDVTIWVQAGDVVQGGQQDRTIGVDLALAPQSGQVPIASFCVEQGRWSVRGGGGGARQIAVLNDEAQTGIATDEQQMRGIQTVEQTEAPALQTDMQFDDFAFTSTQSSASAGVAFELSENNVSTLELKKAVLLDVDQSEVWANVAIGQSKLTANVSSGVVDPDSPTSWQLTLGSEAAREAMAAYESAIGGALEGHDDVVGCVVSINGTLDSADVYGSRDLFEKLWPKLLRGSAIAALAAKDQPTAENPADEQAVRAFLADADGDSVHTRNVGDRGIMTMGQNPYGHVVESKAAGQQGWVHRTYLRK